MTLIKEINLTLKSYQITLMAISTFSIAIQDKFYYLGFCIQKCDVNLMRTKIVCGYSCCIKNIEITTAKSINDTKLYFQS